MTSAPTGPLVQQQNKLWREEPLPGAHEFSAADLHKRLRSVELQQPPGRDSTAPPQHAAARDEFPRSAAGDQFLITSLQEEVRFPCSCMNFQETAHLNQILMLRCNIGCLL